MVDGLVPVPLPLVVRLHCAIPSGVGVVGREAVGGGRWSVIEAVTAGCRLRSCTERPGSGRNCTRVLAGGASRVPTPSGSAPSKGPPITAAPRDSCFLVWVLFLV